MIHSDNNPLYTSAEIGHMVAVIVILKAVLEGVKGMAEQEANHGSMAWRQALTTINMALDEAAPPVVPPRPEFMHDAEGRNR